MSDSLLAIIPNSDGNFYFESFGEALIYALIGFLVVFFGIVLIICIIWLLGLLLRKTNNLAFLTRVGRKKIKPKETKVIIPEDNGDIPDEIKAAIMAAIMAYYSDKKPECEFRVRRIKRI